MFSCLRRSDRRTATAWAKYVYASCLEAQTLAKNQSSFKVFITQLGRVDTV